MGKSRKILSLTTKSNKTIFQFLSIIMNELVLSILKKTAIIRYMLMDQGCPYTNLD